MKKCLSLMLTALAVLISCSDEENKPKEVQCTEEYFLDTAFGWTAFYNEDELISDYILKGDTLIKFRYNQNKKLEWMITNSTTRHYVYDAQNRIQYTLQRYNGIASDSLTWEYENDTDLSSAVNYYSGGNLMRRDEFSWEGRNPVMVDVHVYGNDLTYSMGFEYDNNPKPTEQVLMPYFYQFPDKSFGTNNITREIFYWEDNGESSGDIVYSLKYNNGNMPTQLQWDTHKLNFTYRCSPRIRG